MKSRIILNYVNMNYIIYNLWKIETGDAWYIIKDFVESASRVCEPFDNPFWSLNVYRESVKMEYKLYVDKWHIFWQVEKVYLFQSTSMYYVI